MTILDPGLDSIRGTEIRRGAVNQAVRQPRGAARRGIGPGVGPGVGPGPVRGCDRRPGPARPPIAPLRYRARGIAVARIDRPVRPVRTSVAVGLAALTALITLWLGVIAQFSGGHLSAEGLPAAGSPVPGRLGVVQMLPGETLGQLAARVAPESAPEQVVDRIRDLNKLGADGPGAGQTLIAPLG